MSSECTNKQAFNAKNNADQIHIESTHNPKSASDALRGSNKVFTATADNAGVQVVLQFTFRASKVPFAYELTFDAQNVDKAMIGLAVGDRYYNSY